MNTTFYINDKEKFLTEVTDILDTYRDLIIQIKDKPVCQLPWIKVRGLHTSVKGSSPLTY